ATLVVVSGDVDPGTAIRSVARAFGGWKVLAPAPPKLVFAAVPDVAPGTAAPRLPVSAAGEAALAIGGLGPGRTDKDRAALSAVEVTLRAHLEKTLRTDAALAHWVE